MDHASIPIQQQQQRHANGGEGRSGSSGAGGVTASVCRPTGARWTPTSEQIRILRELYYGCGIRSPNAEQIQRIAARLRQYGRIEGKNVFYWFQNHKARERQKKRLTTIDVNTTAAADANHLAGVLSLSPSDAAVASSAGFYAGNGGSGVQLEASANCWDSSTAMATERSFMQLQDYMGLRSTGGHHGGAGDAASWACFPFPADQTPMTTTRTSTATREPETLPLFPTGGRHGGPGEGGHGHQESVVHGSYPQSNFPCWGAAAATTITVQQHHHQLLQQLQEQHSFCSISNQLPSQDAAAGTSLELTLSSYCSPYPAGSM